MKWLIAFIMAIVTSRRRKIRSAGSSGYLPLLQTDNKGPATQNAVCRSGLRSLSAAECYILSRLF